MQIIHKYINMKICIIHYTQYLMIISYIDFYIIIFLVINYLKNCIAKNIYYNLSAQFLMCVKIVLYSGN